jgi:hypothetical protein
MDVNDLASFARLCSGGLRPSHEFIPSENSATVRDRRYKEGSAPTPGVVFLLLFLIFLSGCSPESPRVASSRAAGQNFASAPTDRPGLGTKWGETRSSRITITPFERADWTHPIAGAAIYYNNEEGVRAMAGAVAWQRSWPVLPAPIDSLIQVGLKDQSGRFLPGLIIGNRWFVVGEEGRRYSIVVRNRSNLRLEAVLSVDGLDVLDGRRAASGKRGYLLAPHAKVVVEGFRQSTEAVAAFRFGPVRESYANEKYRRTRNVGVIGVVIFNERGSASPWSAAEVQKRLDANPFPGFATPPW